MSESAEGFRLAATRRNAGSALNTRGAFAGGGAPLAGAGGVKAPGSTVCACVIVVFGNASDDSRSHDGPAFGV